MDRGLVLVTGANGFVGKWVVIELLRAGFSVRGSVRSESKAEAVRVAVRAQVGEEALSRLEFIRLSLLHDNHWDEAMAGLDAVMHVAAHIVDREPANMEEVVGPALEGTERVLRFAAANGVHRIILTSSIATIGYGHGHETGAHTYTEDHVTDLSRLRHPWAYCVGKTKAEQSAWAYARAENMALTTIHPGAILGPALDQDASVSLGMVGDLLAGKLPALPRIGFSVVDVRDVAALHVAALQRPHSVGHRYLATSDYLRFSDIATILRAAYPAARITGRTIPDWVLRLVARFDRTTRQILNDVGNEKHYDRRRGELLLTHGFRSGREAVLAAAESLIAQGLVKLPG